MTAARVGRRALVLSALTAATLAFAAPATAAYTAKLQAGTLKVTGDGASDKLALRLGSPTTLQVDVGADGTAEFSFDRTTFTAIGVSAGGGDDEVRIDQSGGAFTDEAVTINGGGGNDTLIGGAGAETFVGGAGNDVVDGNQGEDQALLGGGADRFQWDPGDSSDTIDGEAGADLLDVNGSAIGESIDLSANGGRLRFFRNIGNVVLDAGGVERAGFHAFGGADTIVVNDLAGTGVKTAEIDLSTVDTQPDTVVARGTDGADAVSVASPAGKVVISGLAAQVQVAGAEAAFDDVNVATLGGADTISMGIGVSGPASINVDGGDGADVTRYAGTAGNDVISVVANGTEVSTVADATSRVDTTAVESVVLLGLAGTDTMTAVGNLAPLTQLTLDGGIGEDTLSGGNGPDLLLGGAGNDVVDGNQGEDRALLGGGDDRFQWDPGDGNDTIEGEVGDDLLDVSGSAIGESIDVSANGGRVRFFRNIANIVLDSDDVERVTFHARGGTDAIVVNDLAGTDARKVDVDLSGPDGAGDGAPDTVTAVGTSGPDRVTLSSPGGYPTVSGLFAQVLVEGVEAANDDVNVSTLAGDDTITTGREVFGPASYNVDGGEGTDVTRFNGTDVADEIAVFANGTEVSTVAPLAARLDTTAVESLVLLGLAGPDTMSAVGNLAPLTTLTMDGGPDEDVLRGGNGPDLLIGGPANDVVDGNQGEDRALLGAGADTFQWDPGDGNDVVEGETGDDTLAFNGSNIGENIDISANGGRVRFTRNVANIVLDVDDVEHLAFRAFGGADAIVVNDLAGTDAKTVDVDLSASVGGGDAQADTVTVNGTSGPDAVHVTRSGEQVLASGLAAQTRITASEATLDTLQILTLDGDDDVTVAPDVSDLITTVVDLGAGD